MSELPDFLGGEDAPEIETAAPAVAETAPQPEQATPAGDTPVPVGQEAPAEPPVAQHVPLATFLDLRDRANNAEKEAKELREWRQQQEAQRRQPAPQMDMSDPVAVMAEVAFETRRDTSLDLARMRHGDELVSAAFEWAGKRCDDDPVFNNQIRRSNDVGKFIVDAFQRDQMVSQVNPNDYAAFQAWKASQPQQPGAVPQGHAPPASPAAPRASLAAAPSASSSAAPAPRDGASTYESMFG